MGAWSEFVCGACGYDAMVSGRDDLGFFTRTTTILCEDCGELYDVVTSRRPGGPGAEGKRMGAIEPGCPRSVEHAFRRWTHPDICPKCGSTMVLGEKITMWD